MTAPIPISSTPPHAHSQMPVTSTTPSSSLSMSPQTPFFPTPSINSTVAPGSLPTPTQTNGILKWAASLGKSPIQQKGGFDFAPVIEHEHEYEHEHDSVEFGDFNDLKHRSWNGAGHGKRAVSMSFASGQNQGGIAAMLKGNSGLSDQLPPATTTTQQHSPPIGTAPMPATGVLAENAAKGQGVLRRLSLSSSSFTRPSFLSPPLQTAPLPPSPPSMANSGPAPLPVPAPAPPQADVGVQRAATLAAPGGRMRGRRYSENSGAKKRGVSPMGERLLRDHGHF